MRKNRSPQPGKDPRSILVHTRGFFDGRSPVLSVLLGLAFIGTVAFLDHQVGSEISLGALYLMPIGLMTWNLGRRWGAFAVVVSTIVSVAGQVVPDVTLSRTDAWPYWRGVVSFAVFLTFSILLDTLKSIIDAQWELIQREAEVATSLREVNEMKDTLLRTVSHDLRNPLAGILGAVSTLQRADELELTDREIARLHESIEGGGRKMHRLIEDLLDMERIARSELEPNRTPVDLGAIATRLVEESSDLDLHPVRIAADPVLVDVDATQAERILENLLVNAARHTLPGTAVRVRVERRKHGVDLIVEDEGSGVPDDLKDVLFEPFRQGGTADGRGTGLGLSLVRRFAQLHGGDARVEDGEAGGARFVVTLPGAVIDRPEVAAPDEVPATELRAV